MIVILFWSLLEAEIAVMIASNASMGMHLIIKEKSLELYFSERDSRVQRNLIWRTWWSSWSRRETEVGTNKDDLPGYRLEKLSGSSPLDTVAASTETELPSYQPRRLPVIVENSAPHSNKTLRSIRRSDTQT